MRVLIEIFKHFNKINNSKILGSIRRGFVFAIPVVLAGSLAVLLSGIPISGYQSFLDTALNGEIRNVLTFVNQGTYGFISIVLLITIPYSYGEYSERSYSDCIIMSTISLASFVAFNGLSTLISDANVLSSQGLFTAILISTISSILFVKLTSIKHLNRDLYSYGSDVNFDRAVKSIVPGTLIISAFGLLNVLFSIIFGVQSFQELLASKLTLLFSESGRSLNSTLLFILLVHLLWFFGIHGSKALDAVAEGLFAQGLDINLNLLSMGHPPTEILTKSFVDTFVLMGGCGSALCLIVAIAIKSKTRHVREISKLGFIPVLFNINEIVIFGIPVVLNPIMLIPFIITPILLTITSYFAVSFGLMPITINHVEWTTPILFSGYLATHSLKGSFLQIINLIIGTCIYVPFVKLSEEMHVLSLKNDINSLINDVIECEKAGVTPDFLNKKRRFAPIVRMLILDLKHAMKNNDLHIYYQSQVDYDYKITGAEALLRWEHPLCGNIYPPLIIALAKEGGFLDALGGFIMDKACNDLNFLKNEIKHDLKISINISVDQLDNPNFFLDIKGLLERYNIKPSMFGIELTEQIALKNTPRINHTLSEIRELGVQLILDDFGMGHSSMMYLQNNKFDLVKLDGALTREILSNPRSEEIIKSIVILSKSLGFSLIAEYVDSEEQRDRLYDTGCTVYQGYLYSKPLSLKDFIQYYRMEQFEKNEEVS